MIALRAQRTYQRAWARPCESRSGANRLWSPEELVEQTSCWESEMALGDWLIQLHPVKGVPENAIYFVDFGAMLAFVRKSKKRMSDDIVRVHTPARATPEQREKLRGLGCVPL